jgi:hypothetical protein
VTDDNPAPQPDPGPASGEAALALCTGFVHALPVSGASISVMSAIGAQITIGITDPTAAEIERIQFELGEGPHWDVLKTGLPVMVADASTENSDRWPMFSRAISTVPVGAIFAFPLTMGAVTVGVVDLYRSTPGALRADEVSAGLALAEEISEQALLQAVASASVSGAESAMTPAMRREIHQATGMILIQLNVSATEAFTRLQARAFADSRSVAEVAHDVVQRSLSFSFDHD